MSTELEQGDLLAAAYLRAEGVGERFERKIHPGDDMLRVIARSGVVAERRKLLYFQHGREAFRAVEHALRAAGIAWSDRLAFLEFACGYGRFTRFLVQRLAPQRITASDILPEAVRFVTERFATEPLDSHVEPERVRFLRRYDVIWVGSLFSHLPRPRFEAWLRALYAQLAPGGVLLFTTHAWERCPEAWSNDEGFAFARQSETSDLEVDEYGTTYVEQGCLERIASACGIAQLRSRSLDLWSTQDLHVASREKIAGLESWTSTPTARGELALEINQRERHGRVDGWVQIPASALPARRVMLLLDEREVGEALLGPRIEHRPEAPFREALHAHELFLEGPLPPLEPGFHSLAAVVEDARGERQCFAVTGFEIRRRGTDKGAWHLYLSSLERRKLAEEAGGFLCLARRVRAAREVEAPAGEAREDVPQRRVPPGSAAPRGPCMRTSSSSRVRCRRSSRASIPSRPWSRTPASRANAPP